MTTLYAVRLADGSFMGPRKLIPDIQSPVFFYSAVDAGNAVLWMKAAGKMDEEADYEVAKIVVSDDITYRVSSSLDAAESDHVNITIVNPDTVKK